MQAGSLPSELQTNTFKWDYQKQLELKLELLIPGSLQGSTFMQIKPYLRLINQYDIFCDKSQISFPFFISCSCGQGHSWVDIAQGEYPAMGSSD